MTRIWLGLALLVGCDSADVAPDGAADAAPPPPDPTIVADPSLLRVADPSLPGFDGWPLPFTATGGAGCRVAVAALASFESCAPVWDGAGATPGALAVTAAVVDEDGATLAETSVEIHVVRVGVTSVQLASSGRVPLVWPETMWELDATTAPWKVGSIDEAAPVVWEDLASEPDDALTWNLPIALVAGSEVAAEATIDGSFGAAEVRALAPAVESPRAVERVDREIAWRFEGRAPGGEWQAMPGAITTAHRLYGVVGSPAVGWGDLPHGAWIDVVDTVTRWANGQVLAPEEVAASIVEGVYYDLGLRYDAESGASAYTWYAGDGFDGGSFALSAFRAREFGSIINCSDAASIVETYAGMVGVDLRYHILVSGVSDGFDLNFIMPIGFAEFDETPFTGGRGAFRYHAVVGPASGTFFDATLALDGDGDATQPPHTVLLPTNLDQAVYLEALSSEFDEIVVHHDDKVRLQ